MDKPVMVKEVDLTRARLSDAFKKDVRKVKEMHDFVQRVTGNTNPQIIDLFYDELTQSCFSPICLLECHRAAIEAVKEGLFGTDIHNELLAYLTYKIDEELRRILEDYTVSTVRANPADVKKQLEELKNEG